MAKSSTSTGDDNPVTDLGVATLDRTIYSDTLRKQENKETISSRNAMLLSSTHGTQD